MLFKSIENPQLMPEAVLKTETELEPEETVTIETIAKEYGLEIEFIEKNISKRNIPKNLKILRNHLKNLEDSFSKKEIEEMVKKHPKILKHKRETINNYLKDLEKCDLSKKYGFSKKEIRNIIKKWPRLLISSPETINNHLENLEDYGFSKEEVRSMIKKWPTILEYKTERIGKSIEWIHQHVPKINLVDSPKKLIFSAKTLEERRLTLELLKYPYKEYHQPLFCSEGRWQNFIVQEMKAVMKKENKK